MPDNVTLDNNTTTGETIRTVRKASVQYPVSIIDVGTHPSDNSGSPSLVSKEGNIGMPVEGLSNSETVSSGAPVLIGAKHLSTIPTLTDTHAATLLVDERNNLFTTIVGKNTDNGIAIDGNGAISVAGVATIDYDTLAGSDNTDNTACVGIVVPADGGAAAVESTSIQNTVAGVPADPVAGLNTSQIGSFFFDGHTGANDTTNVAAFGIAIASSAGPKAVGTDGTTTTYLPVSLENGIVSDFDTEASDPELASQISNGLAFGIAVPSAGGPAVVGDGSTTLPVSGSVSISSGSINASVSGSVTLDAAADENSVIGTVKLPDDETIVIQGNNGSTKTDVAVDTSGHLQVDALTLPAITGWDYALSSPAAQKMKVDAAGSVHIADVNTHVSNFDNAGGQTVNASSYGVVVPSASGPVVVGGDANGLNTKSMAIVQNNISGNTLSGVSQLRVDETGALHVTGISGGGGSSAYVYVDDADWSATSSSHALIGGVYQSTRGTITDGDTGPVRVTSTGQVHAYLDDVTYTANSVITNPDTVAKVSMVGAVVDEVLEAASTPYSDGDAAPLKVTRTGALHVEVGNFPSTQTVDGTVTANVSFPQTQVVDLSTNNDVRIVGSAADGLEVHSSVTYTSGIITLGGATNRCLYSISAFNLTGNKLFLKFFSASSPVLGTTAASMTFLIPANADNGAGFVLSVPQGMDTGNNGIQYAITTGVSQSSTTGVSSGDVILNLAFK